MAETRTWASSNGSSSRGEDCCADLVPRILLSMQCCGCCFLPPACSVAHTAPRTHSAGSCNPTPHATWVHIPCLNTNCNTKIRRVFNQKINIKELSQQQAPHTTLTLRAIQQLSHPPAILMPTFCICGSVSEPASGQSCIAKVLRGQSRAMYFDQKCDWLITIGGKSCSSDSRLNLP